MGRLIRFTICGASGVGKTSIIEHCIYGNYFSRRSEDFFSTFEDTYNAVIETDRGVKEKVRIYELGGTSKLERHFVNCTDAFILVFDSSQATSFDYVQKIKQTIDAYKDKRDLIMILCCHKVDKLKDPLIDDKVIATWAQNEKSKSGFPFGKKEMR